MYKKYLASTLFMAQMCILLFICFSFNGVGLEADSITHYLFAKYAPIHPHLFLDHWAKPVYTILASPFAQFGIIGVKIFNGLNAILTSVLLYNISKKTDAKQPLLASLLYFCFPLFYTVTFSGLTEPLAALAITATIYFYQNKNYFITAIIISFFPFIRSEGLVFLIVFIGIFLYRKNWKALLLLSTGHLLMGLIGLFHYDSILWVFTRIPYAKINPLYGSGTWFHFFEKLIYILGVPGLILFLLGIVFSVISFRVKKLVSTHTIILLCFSAFFMAHVIFWKFGLFNSLGLHRVMGTILPLMALIAANGWDNLLKWSTDRKYLKFIHYGLLLYLIGFLFTTNPASVNWEEELNLSKRQLLTQKASQFVQSQLTEDSKLFYNDNYLSELLDIDPFDPTIREPLYDSKLHLTSPGDLIIWDSWYSIGESGLNFDQVMKHPNLELIKTIEDQENNLALKYFVFKVKHP